MEGWWAPGPSVVYTGPPPPEAILRQDPQLANTGPPLHPLDSPSREARTVYVGNIPCGLTEVCATGHILILPLPCKVR